MSIDLEKLAKECIASADIIKQVNNRDKKETNKMNNTEQIVLTEKNIEGKVTMTFPLNLIETLSGMKAYKCDLNTFPHDAVKGQIFDAGYQKRFDRAEAYVDEISSGRLTRVIRATDGSLFALQFTTFNDLRTMLKAVSRLVQSSACVSCRITRFDQASVLDFQYKPVTDRLYYAVSIQHYDNHKGFIEGITDTIWKFAVSPASDKDVKIK